MSDLAEVGHLSIHRSLFEIGMSWTPATEVDYGTYPAGLQELLSGRPHIPNSWHEVLPGFSQAALSHIINTFWLLKR